MSDATPAQDAPAVPQPSQGGSYVLDPQTLQLTRVAYTRTSVDADAAPAAEPATQGEAPAP